MSAHPTPMPSVQRLARLFEDLLGRGTLVKDHQLTTPLARDAAGMVVEMRTDDGKLRVAAGLDQPLTIASGAALFLIPPSTARAAVAAGAMTDDVRDSAYEVLNVVASLFNASGAAHVRVTDRWHPGVEAPAEVWDLLETAYRRLDVTLDIDGYGAGHATFAIAS